MIDGMIYVPTWLLIGMGLACFGFGAFLGRISR